MHKVDREGWPSLAFRLAVGQRNHSIRGARRQILQRRQMALLDRQDRAFQVGSGNRLANRIPRKLPSDASPLGRARTGPTRRRRSLAMEHDRRGCSIKRHEPFLSGSWECDLCHRYNFRGRFFYNTSKPPEVLLKSRNMTSHS
jgi:hypothetical protein